MKKVALLFCLIVGLFTVAGQGAYAQSIGYTQLVKKISVLNNRASFRLPSQARDIARGSLMSASPNQNSETRIIFDIDKMRFVLLATELYKYTKGDFFKEVNRSPLYSAYEKKIIANKNGAISILLQPSAIDSVNDAILIQSILVKTRDNTVFKAEAYISPSAFKKKSEFIKLSTRIFESLRIGLRTPFRKGSAEEVNIWGTKMNFKLTVPQDYNITVDKKYDFQVIRFHKYTAFSDTSWFLLTIYTGEYPWKDYEHFGFKEDSAKNINGFFLDKQISWMMFEDKNKSVFVKEQKMPLEQRDDGLLVHIGMISNKRETIDDLTNIVEMIKLEN